MTFPELGLIAVVLGIVTGVLGAWWNGQRHRRDQEKWRAEREEDLEKMAKRVCQEFTNSDEYTNRKEKRIAEIANQVVNAHFTQRADSFVDTKEFIRSEKALLAAIADLSTRMQTLTASVGSIDGRISQTVANSVAQQLLPLLTGRVIVGSEVGDETGTRKP